MAHYELLLFGKTNQFVGSRKCDLGADHDALSIAFALVPSYSAVEVWVGVRMVARVPSWSASSRSMPFIGLSANAVPLARMAVTPRIGVSPSRIAPPLVSAQTLPAYQPIRPLCVDRPAGEPGGACGSTA
jgi:hypothetical protein